MDIISVISYPHLREGNKQIKKIILIVPMFIINSPEDAKRKELDDPITQYPLSAYNPNIQPTP
jgi:hypothetical protein